MTMCSSAKRWRACSNRSRTFRSSARPPRLKTRSGSLEARRLLQRGRSGIFLKNEKPSLLIEKDPHRDDRAGHSGGARSGVPADAPKPVSFTPRERQVLQRVCQGRTNKEIASELGISEPPGESVRTAALRKDRGPQPGAARLGGCGALLGATGRNRLGPLAVAQLHDGLTATVAALHRAGRSG